MYMSALAPKDFLSYIPDFLLDESMRPDVALQVLQRAGKMSNFHFASMANGLMNFFDTLSHPKAWDKEYASWFSTPEIVEVRMFYRRYNQDHRRSGDVLGNKARIYHVGSAYRQKEETTLPIDTGFISYRGSRTHQMDICFQEALASTMAYNGLYSLGQAASLRKNNVPGTETTDPYRYISGLRGNYTPHVNPAEFSHILHPALRLAGISLDEFSKRELDFALEALLTAPSPHDMVDELCDGLNLDMSRAEKDALFAYNNNPDHNPDPDPSHKDYPEGMNVVDSFRWIKDRIL